MIEAEEIGIQDLGSFRTDVINGLTAKPKRLSSKYFYDKNGDELFQRIMECSEYYLTDCEFDIFKNQTHELAKLINGNNKLPFDLIELGVGDGTKTQYLLKELIKDKSQFTYLPIDISGNILSELEKNLTDLDELQLVPLEGEYLECLMEAVQRTDNRKVVLFLGANIGNLDKTAAGHFCREIRSVLSPGDLFVIGFDLKKNPITILNAYNDKSGITSEFNLNLLKRINRELAGEFKTEKFVHYPTYDPVSGECKSYLISQEEQTVNISGIDIKFEEGEWIYMEISQKYSLQEIKTLATNSGFAVSGSLLDKKNWFVDSVWTAMPIDNIQ